MRTSKAPGAVVAAGGFVVLCAVLAFPASADRAPLEDYRSAPLTYMPWPPPAKYAAFIWTGHCLDIRLPDRQERYCPPGMASDR